MGRAYDWAIHFFPRSEFVARVRIDAPSCLPSIDELGRLPVDRPVLVTNDFDVLALGGGSQVYFTSDRYAFVPVALTTSYFEAWRIWYGATTHAMRGFTASTLLLSGAVLPTASVV